MLFVFVCPPFQLEDFDFATSYSISVQRIHDVLLDMGYSHDNAHLLIYEVDDAAEQYGPGRTSSATR